MNNLKSNNSNSIHQGDTGRKRTNFKAKCKPVLEHSRQLRHPFNFFAVMLIPLLDASKIRVGTVTARQILLVESRILADQVAVRLMNVGK